MNAGTLSSNLFSYHSADKIFSAEISTLERAQSSLRRLYASDKVGFVLKSAKTGNEAVFDLASKRVDRDDDIQFWTFFPTDAAVRANPALRGVSVIIYNT